MHQRIKRLTLEMDRRSPARLEELDRFFASASFRPPDDYLALVTQTDGGEGSVGNAYLSIYGVREMEACNTVTSTIEPQLLFFGTNGGGEGYEFDTTDHLYNCH